MESPQPHIRFANQPHEGKLKQRPFSFFFNEYFAGIKGEYDNHRLLYARDDRL